MKPIPRRMNAVSGLVDSLDLDALGQNDSNKRLKVFEWTVAEAVAQYDCAVRELKRLGHR
jgi:hypothetical protein